MARNFFNDKGKLPMENSSFATTCNRLSSFLKAKGSLRNLAIHANLDDTGIYMSESETYILLHFSRFSIISELLKDGFVSRSKLTFLLILL